MRVCYAITYSTNHELIAVIIFFLIYLFNSPKIINKFDSYILARYFHNARIGIRCIESGDLSNL